MNWGGIMIAEGPGVVRREKINYQKINFGGKKIILEKTWNFLASNTPRPPISDFNKFQPNRSSVWPTIHNIYINECLVLLYRLYIPRILHSIIVTTKKYFCKVCFAENLIFMEVQLIINKCVISLCLGPGFLSAPRSSSMYLL